MKRLLWIWVLLFCFLPVLCARAKLIKPSRLTEEEVNDYVYALINDADSVHTLIVITYDDANNAYAFVVDSNLHGYDWTNVDGTDLKTGSVTQAFGAVLDDLNTLGPVDGDSYFLVGVAAGVLDWESGVTVRASLGLGTGDNVEFAAATVTEIKLTPGMFIGWFHDGARKAYFQGGGDSENLDIYTPGYMQLLSDGVINLKMSGDQGDYIILQTVNDTPEIRTTENSNLKILPDGGTVLMDDVDLDGSITMDASETVDGVDISVKSAEWDDHVADNSQAHTDYLLNNDDDTMEGVLTSYGIEVGDNNNAEFGTGNETGALGCDGRVYSDGSDLIVQVESPTGLGGTWKNPKLIFTYHDYLDFGAYLPYITSDAGVGAGGGGIFMLGRLLYVKDSSGAVNGTIYVADKADDSKGLQLSYDSDNDFGDITTTAGYLNINATTVVKIPKGYTTDINGQTYRDLLIQDDGTLGYDSSSIRYKENVRDLEDSARIYDLRPVKYDRIDGPKDRVGLIAEEVEAVMPEIVSYKINEITETEHWGPMGLAEREVVIGYETTEEVETYVKSLLIVPMLKEIQKLRAELDTLKAEVEELKGRE